MHCFRSIAVSLLGIGAALYAFTTAQAQSSSIHSVRSDAPPFGCLSLDAILRLASERDPSVALAQAFEVEAQGGVDLAKSLSRPQVSAIARSGFGETGIVGAGVSNSLGVQLSQRIFDFGDAKRARRAASSEYEAAREDTGQARLDAALRAGETFLALREAQAQLEVTRERARYFETLLASVDNLLAQGGATRTERAAVASQLADAEGFVLELGFQKEQAEVTLQILTGARAPVCGSAEPDFTARMAAIAGPDEAFRSAVTDNPGLRAERHRADSLEAQADREARARLPVVNVVATGAYSAFGGFDNFDFRERIGVDVSVPLYAGGALSARQRQARARSSASRARIRDQERQLRLDVVTGWRRILSLQDRLRQRREVERQTALQLEAAEIEKSAGTQTLRELIEIRLEYEAASLRTIQTQYDLERQRLELLAQTNKIVP